MRIQIPATTANMGPGFDCIGMALDLYNYIDFEPLKDIGTCRLSIVGEDELAVGEDNLIYQAYQRVFQRLNQDVMGIEMQFTNNVPFARGLGSSSAAIIGGIKVANEMLGNILSPEEMLNIALEFEGHPDNIAPALLGGVVISTLVNGKVVYKKINVPEQLKCTVVIPDYELSTEAARKVLPAELTIEDTIFNVGRMAFLVDALHTGDLELLKMAIDDKIHQPYRSGLIANMEDIKEIALKQGALAVAISGAGPTIIIFDSQEHHDYKEVEQSLMKQQIGCQIRRLDPVNQGATIIK